MDVGEKMVGESLGNQSLPAKEWIESTHAGEIKIL
jgi:hypothetical protein